MILFKVYNDDKIRRWNGFPTLKDPRVFENTLLRIINELFTVFGLPQVSEFNIYDPRFFNLFFTYLTTSNLNSWGQLPLGYIYNDMIRIIQNQNTPNNFFFTLESIEISGNECTKTYNTGDDSSDMSGELVSAYIMENYLLSYRYMKTHNNGILVIRIPYQDKSITYILSVGFNSYENANWFGIGPRSIPNTRYDSLRSIVNVKYGFSMFDQGSKVGFECTDGRGRITSQECIKVVEKYRLETLKKKSDFDTEVKYGNYPIDYNWLNIYDIATPAVMFIHDGKEAKQVINKFNQDSNTRIDYRLLKKENELIGIEEKKKKLMG